MSMREQGQPMYRVKLGSRAAKDADRLPDSIWQRVLAALRVLQETPRPRDSLKLKGIEGLYRLRVGDYRALYDIDDDEQLVIVLRIQHRREACREL
jgi:mRNA interferase RelE/StbE